MLKKLKEKLAKRKAVKQQQEEIKLKWQLENLNYLTDKRLKELGKDYPQAKDLYLKRVKDRLEKKAIKEAQEDTMIRQIEKRIERGEKGSNLDQKIGRGIAKIDKFFTNVAKEMDEFAKDQKKQWR